MSTPEPTRIMFRNVYWQPRPTALPRRIMSRDIACPRQALAAAVARSGDSYAELSRLIGKRNGYLACFVREGHPRALSADSHRILADWFGVDERALGVRDLWSAKDEAE